MDTTLQEKIRHAPTCAGVYIMKDRLGQVIYIGKAKNIKRRVSQYFQGSKRRLHSFKIPYLVECVADIEFQECKNEAQALLLESKLIKDWKPRYNSDLKDNKNFLLLRVEMFKELPVFTLCRFRKEDKSIYFGPYPSSKKINSVLQYLKKEFGVISKDAKPKKLKDSDLWVLYNDARAEIYAHPSTLSTQEYMQRVTNALEFLKGQSKEILKDLELKMIDASEKMLYEKATFYRDQISAIKETIKLNKQSKSIADIAKSSKEIAQIALKELSEVLNSPQEIVSMECFDISHTSGSFCVASMVRFENGIPKKAKYRKYHIKSFIGNDDFRAMNEAVDRRYKNAETPPDLLVIDGGAGQLTAVECLLDAMQQRPKQIIGLAKREETIVLSGSHAEIKLGTANEAVKLLQRIRDEAHRFANTFNADLRSKKIKESILDDFNVSESKKILLLNEFGTIKNLKQAQAKDIAKLKGISLNYAEKLLDFLKNTSK